MIIDRLHIKIKNSYAYAAIIIVGVFILIFFYIKTINMQSDLERIQNDGFIMVKINENSVAPKLKSVGLGNNGQTQIRGFAPAVWIPDGQMSAEILKNGEVVDKIFCYSESAWITKTTIPFLCETNVDINGGQSQIKFIRTSSETDEAINEATIELNENQTN